MSCFLYYNTLFFLILLILKILKILILKKGKTTSHQPISLSTTIISNTDQITMQHQLHRHQVKDERMCNAKNKKRRAKAGRNPTKSSALQKKRIHSSPENVDINQYKKQSKKCGIRGP